MLLAATTPPRLFTLVILTAFSVLTLNIFVPSLASMAEDFETEYGVITLAIAGYLAVTGVLMLVIGPLSDRFGRRPVLLSAVTVYIVASLACTFAQNVWLFLAFRLVQGTIIGGWTLSLAVIRDTAPPREAASRIGYVTMAMAVAPMLAPIAGGFLETHFGWRATFLLMAALGVFAFLLAWVDLGETNHSRSETLTQQLRSYPALLREPRFWGYALCLAFSSGAFYSFIAGAPLVAVSVLGLSSEALGLYLGTITAGFFLGSYLSGRYAGRFPLTSMMLAGRMVSAAGLTLGLALMAAGYVNVVTFFGATVFVGMGNGLTIPSCSAGALSVQPRLAGSASGLAGAVNLFCGAVLTTTVGAVVGGAQAAAILLAILLLLSCLGLTAVLLVRRLERRSAATAAA